MLVALVFVLARNIVKLIVERRRGAAVRALPRQAGRRAARDDARAGGARADRRQRADPQQRRPLVQRADGRDPVVGQRDRRATTTTSGSVLVTRPGGAHRAGARPPSTWRRRTSRPCATVVAPEVTQQRVQLVEVYRVRPATAAPPQPAPVVDVASPALPPGAAARRGRSAGRARRGRRRPRRAVARAARRRRRAAARGGRRSAAPTARPTGVVVASDYLTGELAARVAAHDAGVRGLPAAARAEAAADRRLPVVLPDGDADDPGRRDLDGAVPRQAHHAAGADAGGRGARDRRRPPRSPRRAARRDDEFGSLVEAFNTMAGELATSRRRLERSTRRSRAQARRGRRAAPLHRDDPRAHRDRRRLGRRRRAHQHDQRAAARLLGSTPASSGSRRATVFARADLRAARRAARHGARRGAASRPPQEIALARDGRELHLAAVATPLHGDGGAPKARCWCSTT